MPDTPELIAGEWYFVCENPFEVGGGSGRFEDATGSGNLSARVLFVGFGVPDWPGSWTGFAAYVCPSVLLRSARGGPGILRLWDVVKLSTT